ncbi:MAG TPA: DUF222 domain-containing protein [Acidimicrobiia bacterium]|nr:DUF222 domain-containing protein [Acidimicrobiia bacterium]
MGRIRAATAEVAGQDWSRWTSQSRTEHLVELLGVIERLQAAVVARVGEWDAHLDWAVLGAASPRAYLAHRAPVCRAHASRLVAMGRLCHQHEATGAAVASGEVSCAHLDVLAPMIRHREQEYAANEQTLLDAARDLPADDFAVAARYWRAAADDAVGAPAGRGHQEARNLHVRVTLQGMGAVEGDLDAETTALLLEALERAAPPDGTDGPEPPRSLAQRRHDGLADICRAYLDRARTGGRPATALHVVIDHLTASGQLPSDPRRIRCELDHVGPVPFDTARRLACDCAVARVLMRGDSELLDLGRSRRLVTGPLRHALEIRDRGCVWPGCDRPTAWCDAHHLIRWEHGGPTSLANCCLLCRRHHMLCHEGGWGLQRRPDGTYQATEPSPDVIGRHRRRRRRAPPIAA